jgi:hypothetical protein
MPFTSPFFVPGEDIAQIIITSDIQRYLGLGASVQPGQGTGEDEGRAGYWVTSNNALTPQMVEDMKLDTQRWEAEHGKERGRRGERHKAQMSGYMYETTGAGYEHSAHGATTTTGKGQGASESASYDTIAYLDQGSTHSQPHVEEARAYDKAPTT